jgi:hypothetical protein
MPEAARTHYCLVLQLHLSIFASSPALLGWHQRTAHDNNSNRTCI